MAWDSVEIGLAGGEETVNFGPRNETGSSLYQVDTLASISPSEKVQGLPLIYSASSQDGFCMALSKQVLLFNSSCTVHHATLNFDSDVDRVALSHYSTFAAIGDRCGNLNFLYTATKQILFSQQLVQPLDNNGLIFLDITFTPPSNDNGTESLVILTSSGLLFEFSCLKLEEFQEAVNSQDFEQVKQLKQSIVTKCSSVEGGHDEVLTGLATLAHDGSNEFITYGKSSSLALWGTNPFDVKGSGDIVLLDKIESLMLGSEVIKACPTSDNNFLVVLDEQHMLSLWDISSLTMVAFWHFLSVDDFLLVSTSDVKTNTASSEEEHKIIILTKPANSQEKRFLQVYTLPTMKQTYSLQVSKTCFLAHITSNQETIYFTEAVQKCDDDNEEDTVTLRIRCLTEALPENRFYRLLHKHQFDAAEKFAKQFNLDTELVYKVKANTLLDKVSQWSSSQDHEDFDFEELKQCLSKIQEDDYVINCCLQAVFPTVEETYTILQYARERASKRDKSSGMICHPHLHNEILGVLNKLVTFENAYGIQQFSGSRWHSFQHADLLDEVKSCFGQGEVSSAVIIWRRHQSSFSKDFNAEKLESLFGSIGQHLQSSLIVPWLRDHLVPFVCKVLPDGVDLLASWLDQRARKMELSEKKGWPANALELVRVLPAPTYDSSAKKDSNTTSSKESGLARLAELVHGLSELQELHEKYSCRIGLAEYTEETTKTIVFRLLDGVKAAELLPQAMKKYIAPYITHYGLNKDQVLLEYIQEMFQKISSSCSFLSNSLWEPRVIAVISFIKDKQCYCQATLNVMIKACVPWSDAVTKLVNDAMVSYPNNLELKEQYRFVELKKVLRQYGVKSTQAPVAAKSKRIVRIILNRDEPTAVEDALKVVGAYHNLCESDVYVFRMQKLLQSDRGDECIDLLDSLPKDKASQYVQEIVTWLCCTLEEELPSELDCTQEHITAAQNAILLLKYIKKRGLHTYHDVDNLLQDLTKISLLQKEFSEFFSLDGYQCALKREELVQKYLKIYLQQAGKDAKDDKDEQQQKISFTKLVRLSLLAGITKEELMSRIARNALSVGDVNMALDICRDLLQHAPDPFISQALFSIIHAICKRISEGTMVTMDKNENTDKSNLAKDTHQLICQILNVCPPDLVCDCLEMCKLMSLANEVFAQCETGDYGFSVQSSLNSSRKDLLSEWSFGKRFKEDGLVLDSFIALPLAAKFCLACVPEVQPQNQLSFYQDRVAGSRISDQDGNECANANESLVATPSRLIQVSSAGLNTIRYLQENNLYKLALRYAFESIGICHQHFAANTLNVSELKNTNPVIASELEHLCKISKMGLEISQELIGGLLVKVFNHKVVDHDLGLGYICAIPKQLALDKMKSRTFFPGHNYGKLAAFSDVGVDFALLNNEPTVLETYQIIKNNALWGQKLSKMKIYVKDVYALDREEMMRLLPDLIQHKDINLELLLDFCRSFHLMEEEALLMYIKMQLLPPVSMDTCSHGDDITAPDYEVKVNTVAPMIPSEALVGLLVEVCGKIDAYDYDRIMFVLKLTKDNAPPDIVSLVEKGIQLLEYLYIYERRTPPSKYERSFTYSRNPEDNSKMTVTTEKPLSEMSKKRLPFHPILYGDPWKVIADELSEETVPKLIGVAKLLKLSRDQMYLTAIQNLFKSPKSQQNFDSCDNTQLKPNLQSGDMLDRFDFEMARGLLYAVKNKEMAIAAAKWISQQLPLGEEKIKVLEACVDLANEWKTNCPADDVNKANKLYDRLKELSRGVATEHVLHKYSIAEPALVDLVTQPAKLICQLYENYGARDITTRNQPPDINKASDQIAAINNSSIAKIRLYLIEKWLPSRPVTDESRLDAMNQTQLDADEKSDDAINLKRVVYILQDSPPEHSAMFLLNFAYTEMSSTNISCRCRLRSLQALFAIFQDDVIEEVAKKNVVSIRQYMKSLTYMAEFEALHIQQSLNAFQKCNKEGLVRGLWRNHNHEKRGVRLIADLCLDNEIHDPQLWNSVLQQLLSFGMIRYLRHVLVCLAAVSDLWLIPCLPKVWRSVILAPFKNVSPPLSDDELKSCQESAMLLQRCPLLFDLDLIVVAQHFHRVGLHAYALACLVLVPVHDKQRQKIKELLDTKCAVVILDQLKKQCDEAKMLGHVKTLQEEVYQYIEDNQEYEVLLSTVHFDKMVAYLINTDQLEGLLMKTIKAKRLSNAQSLVHLYHQAHPGSPSGRFVSECNEKLSALDELMAFLESTQRLHEAMPYLPQHEDNNQSMKEDMDTMNEDENADLLIQ